MKLSQSSSTIPVSVLALLLFTSLHYAAGAASSEVVSHFKTPPTLEGTPEQGNTLIQTWLMEGFGSIQADLQQLANNPSLNADAVSQFRLRLQKDEAIGAPVDAAITNAQGVIGSMEGLLVSTRLNTETRRQVESNIAATKKQLEQLLLNQQKVVVARGQLGELVKACDYWQQFWNVTARAAGADETRRQLKSLIEQERARLQTWMAGKQGLGSQVENSAIR